MNRRWYRNVSRGFAALAAAVLVSLSLAATPAFAAPAPVAAGELSVLDANGDPVNGALVTITPASGGGFGPELYATTGADGQLALASVAGFEPAGNPYLVWVNANGEAKYWDDTEDANATVPITITNGAPPITATVPANNPPDGTSAGISGTVTDALTGDPIAGVQVSATDDGNGNDNAGASQSGVDGTYYLNFSGGTLPSSADVQFITPTTSADAPYGYGAQSYDNVSEYSGQAETPVPVTAGATVPNIDAAMMPNGLLSGIVTLDGAPLANAQISAWSTASHAVVSGSESDSDGTYSIPTPPGTYKVQFEQIDGEGNTVATLWFLDVATETEATEVVIEANVARTGIDASFGTAPTPTPTPTSTLTPTASPALANSGGSDANLLPILLMGGLVLAMGAVVVVVERRRFGKTR